MHSSDIVTFLRREKWSVHETNNLIANYVPIFYKIWELRYLTNMPFLTAWYNIYTFLLTN
jgi:hypothetical protein